MSFDHDRITPQAWQQNPWPEELAKFIRCKTPRYPNAAHHLPNTPYDIWAGMFKVKNTKRRRKKPLKCAMCQQVIEPGTIAIKASLFWEDDRCFGTEFKDYGTRWLHNLNDCPGES